MIVILLTCLLHTHLLAHFIAYSPHSFIFVILYVVAYTPAQSVHKSVVVMRTVVCSYYNFDLLK